MRLARGIGLLACLACWPASVQPAGAASSQLLTRCGIPAKIPSEKDVPPLVEHLLGDLGGLRTKCENHGIYLLLDATTEFAGNVSGGVKRGATFANQIGLELDIDRQRLAGLVGLSIHVAQGLTFRPELHYVRHPNAQASIRDAVVLGFKANVEF